MVQQYKYGATRGGFTHLHQEGRRWGHVCRYWSSSKKIEIINDKLRGREHTALIRATDLASGFRGGMAGGVALG
jgi:hypothetical protein